MAKRILFVTGTYLPIKKGGIENYTHRLALLLLQNKNEVEVAALQAGNEQEYVYEGIKVNNLKEDFNQFTKLLKEGNFDICHFHEYSSFGGIEMSWFKNAKVHCENVYFTFHLPYFTCYKHDFRYKGQSDCNYFSDPDRCTTCIISDKFNHTKWRNSEILLKVIETALSITSKKQLLKAKVTAHNLLLSELLSVCDQVFVIANWFKKLLYENGYRNDKIKLIPNDLNPLLHNTPAQDAKLQKHRIVFAGRIQHQKGLHLLCEAMQKVQTPNIEIDVFGNIVDEQYFKDCQSKYPFNYKGVIQRRDLMSRLPDYDFLILPSVFTEMYPMVIQEAFQAGIPVIASSAKGNVDLIKDGENGFLFDYNNASDLAKTIAKAYLSMQEGWQPVFSAGEINQNDINEILSYYSLN